MANAITERKRVEEKLAASELRYRRLFETAKDGILILDAETGMVVDVNPFLVELLGLSYEAFLGQAVWELGFFKDVFANQAKFAELQQKEYVRYENLPLETADGRRIDVEFVSNVYLVNNLKVIQCNIRDITEHKRAETLLKELSQRLQHAIKSGNQGVWDWNLQTNEMVWDDRMLELYGVTREGFLGGVEAWKQGLHPDDFSRAVEDCEAALRGERDFDTEFRVRHPDGTVKHIKANGLVTRDANGTPIRMIGLNTDITERKRAAAVLLANEEKFSKTFHNAPLLMTISDVANGWYMDANKKYYETSGFTRDELIEHTSVELGWITPEIRQQLKAKIQEHGRIDGWELTVYPKNRQPLTVLYSAELIQVEGRQCLLSIALDITERKQAEEKLLESENEYRQLYEGSRDGWIFVNMAGVIIQSNKAFRDMVSYTEDELERLTYKDLTPLKWQAMEQDIVEKQVLARGYSELYEKEYIRKDGVIISIELQTYLTTKDGNPAGMWAFIRDISERKKAEAALLQAKDAAEAANRAKSSFLSTMSHELRTPMNAIMGFTDLVLQSKLTPEQKKHLGIVQTRSQDLLVLLQDILDLAKIEAERMELVQDPLSVEQLVSGVMQMFSLSADNKKLSLNKDIPQDLPAVAYGDEQRLRQVLVNLVGNAVKFTEKGGIEVSVNRDPCTDAGSNDVVLHFKVKDTGIGIPPDKIDDIFLPFTQADNSNTRKYGGAGLGLAIVKRLVELMCGNVWVESELDKGSTFHFTAWLALQPATGIDRKKILPTKPSPQRKLLRVLVVEDDPTSSLLAVALTENSGHQVIAVDNGEAALTTLAKDEYDLVLMDIMLPGMNGMEATRQIRNPESLVCNHSIPIIAVTANAMPGDKEKYLTAGMNAYIAKPLTQSVLLAVIDKVMA